MRREDKDKRLALFVSLAVHGTLFVVLAAAGVFTFIQTRSQAEPIDVTVYNEDSMNNLPKLGGGTSKHSMKWVIIGAVSGMFTYYVLYLGYSFLKDLILGNAVATCLADVGVKAVTSGITGILSVIAACLLYIPFHKALTAAGYYRKR